MRKPALRLCKLIQQDNMSVCFIPPHTLLLYSETGVCRGIYYFHIFVLKHIKCLVCTR